MRYLNFFLERLHQQTHARQIGICTVVKCESMYTCYRMICRGRLTINAIYQALTVTASSVSANMHIYAEFCV
jgi:hypothetical protein